MASSSSTGRSGRFGMVSVKTSLELLKFELSWFFRLADVDDYKRLAYYMMRWSIELCLRSRYTRGEDEDETKG